MRIALLVLLSAGLSTMACRKPTKIVHHSKVAAASSHDTLIKHSKASSSKDTFVMHIAASAPDSCLKIPKPPSCPPYLLPIRIDTLPRP